MLKSSRILAAAGAVAGLGLAAAPLNVFATQASDASDQHTDQLVVNVPSVCTFGSYTKGDSPYPGGITHDSYTATTGQYGATSWGDGTSTTDSFADTGHSGSHNTNDVASTGYPSLAADIALTGGTANASYHTVHRTMMAGSTTDTFAQTVLYIVCNDAEGYTVTANPAANLVGDTSSENIPIAASYSATSSGYNLKTIAGSTGVTAVSTLTASGEAEIAYKADQSAEAGDTVTVTYGMGIASSQTADVYAGTVVYKLYKGVNSHSQEP